jgi:hypothetical protein
MRVRDIRRFFQKVNRQLKIPVEVLLTGGAAGLIQGVKRATFDIDFEVRIKRVRPSTAPEWEEVQNAITAASRATGITAQYAEDIDRWSAIPLSAKKSKRYALIGNVDVRILEPGLWSIGKLTRSLQSDVDDMRVVLKTTKADPRKLVRLWGTALGISPSSNVQVDFRRQVIDFIDRYGHEVWGKATDPERLKALFFSTAQKVRQGRTHRGRRR